MDKKLRLSLIFQAAGNATPFLRGVKEESRKAGQALTAARQRVNQLQAAARDVAGLRRLETQLGGTRDKLAAAQREAQRLGQAHAAAERPTKSLTAAFAVARAKVTELKDAEQRQAVALQTVRQRLDEAGVSTKRLGAAEAILTTDLRRANEELAEQQRRLDAVTDRQKRLAAARGRYDKAQAFAGTAQGAGMSSMGAGVAAAAPLVLAGREAMGFEEAMADVRKVVDFPTPRAFRQMSNDILNLADVLPVAKEELAGILAQGARAGVPRAELLAYTEAAAKMGVAFDVSSEEAGAMMAVWRTALGLDHSGVIGLANRVNALTNAFGGNAAAVSDMVTRVGPLGDIAGASGPALAALAQVMNSVGVESEIGATGIKNLLLGLTRGEAATRMQSKAFAALGMDAGDMAKRMQTDAEGAILSVLEAVAKLPKERGLAVLSQLFGTESVAAIAPLLSQLDLVKRNFRAVGDEAFYAGSMDKEFAARAATTANDVRLARNSIAALSVEFGTALLPAIRAGSAWIRTTARSVRDFSAAHPGAVKVVGALVAVIAAGLLIFGGLAMAVAAVLGPFALLQLALTQTSLLFGPMGRGIAGLAGKALPWLGRGLLMAGRGFLSFGGMAARAGLMLMANPIGLAVAAIVAAVALAAYVIYRNWGAIGPWLGRLWRGITAGVGRAFDVVKRIFLTFSPLGIVIRNWRPILGFMRQVGTLIGEVVGLGLDYLAYLLVRFTPLGLIMRNWSGITGFVGRVWTGARDLVDRALQGMGRAVDFGLQTIGGFLMRFTPLGFIVSNWGPISGFVGRVWTAVSSAVSGGIAAVKGFITRWLPLEDFKSVMAGVFSWFENLPSRFLQIGSDIVGGLINGIRGRRDEVQAATRSVAGAAEQGARRRLDTHSPSRVFAAIGSDVMAGFSLGIRTGAAGPVSRMRAAAAAVAAAGMVSVPGAAFAGAQTSLGSQPPSITPALRTSSSSPGRSAGPAAAPKIEIHVHAAPGQSEERIVQLAIERLRVELAGGANLARLGDGGESWGED